MSAAAGAKTTEDYDKAVQGITAHYQVGVNMGFKEIAYPEIPTPAFMRNTGAADELQQMQARQNMITPGSMMRNWGLPGIPTDAAIAAKQKEAAAASYMPQLQEWNLAPQPTEPGPVTDYLPGGAAYPGDRAARRPRPWDQARSNKDRRRAQRLQEEEGEQLPSRKPRRRSITRH